MTEVTVLGRGASLIKLNKFTTDSSKVIVCNTNKLYENQIFDKLEIISVAEVFGESIKRIVEGTSLSSMFHDFN